MERIMYPVDGKNEAIMAENLSVTDRHYIDENSLRWDYKNGDILSIDRKIGYGVPPVLKTYECCGKILELREQPYGLDMFVYSETAGEDLLIFRYKKDEETCLYFEYALNFKGWKRISIPFERGFMNGRPDEAMNQFEIEAVCKKPGTVYFDKINMCTPVRPNDVFTQMHEQVKDLRNHTKRRCAGEWDIITDDKLEPIFRLPKSFEDEDAEAFEEIEKKVYELLDEMDNPPFQLDVSDPEAAAREYESYDIKFRDGVVTGKYLGDGSALIRTMKKTAILYRQTGDPVYRIRYLNMLRHIQDQNTVVNWYNGRGLASSALLMRECLREEGILDETIEYLKTAYHFNRIYATTSTTGIVSAFFEDTDNIGMCLPSLLICILLMDNTPQKLRDMRHFNYYIEKFCMGYAPGIAGGYKPDGTSFHHGNYIRQYQIVSNYSFARVMYAMSGTKFAMSDETVRRFRNVLNTEFIMYNGVFESFVMSQYSFDGKRDTSVVEFAHAANALNDKELAAMYLRLAETSEREVLNPNYTKFIEMGIKPASYFPVNKTLSYSGAVFHRRGDWAMAVRGHSKYSYIMEVWGESRYCAFPMYRSFGFMEILYPPEKGGGTNNGLHTDEGFDWTRWPGSTAVHVPLSQIKSVPIRIEDEWAEWLFSDQGFLGGIDTGDENGVFAMKLHGHEKYGLESFYASKSYHFCDDFVLCMGSGISSRIEEYDVETILFQDYGSGASRDGNVLIDNRNTGYYVYPGQDIKFYDAYTVSRDTIDEKDTFGNRTFAYIDHGKMPKNGKYSYIAKPDATAEEMSRIADGIVILRQDEYAHVVRIKDRTNYVLFIKSYDLPDGLISAVTESCILSVKDDDGMVTLSICDPDLRLYHGQSEDYDLNRRMGTKSIYGRFWHNQESIPSTIQVVVNKRIEDLVIKKGNARIFDSYGDITVLEFICQHGMTNEIIFTY